ncbi:menaquinone biosynthesis prenyltransferase MqnP [Helicobacter sp. 11S02629-2]|uniref:menaquinone biosynthesis prenyltransferase MqnP n=1 Tax=Helicobacter sp. 11S02629-2 TaxID=1476195 RepID=UPI000BA7C86B|nr:menaquinone biosynthesis prenyltransferase MqnP [Helicobacter sp. 11S02629-2]PAF44349.1 4-hydroxybenzoate polyprenyltransferase [Helicobacter sp. 11S02629-2]
MLVGLKKAINNFSELVVFKHTIFSASFILVSLVVASKQLNGTPWFGWRLLILCVIALITARNFAMAFNRFLDYDIDKTNPRTMSRPSVDGRISRSAIGLFCIVNVVIFIVDSYFINSLAFYLSFPFIIILGFYSFVKRFSYLAHIVLGVSLGLAPLSGVIAVLGDIPLWSIYLAIGVLFWVAGFDILYSIQDINHDKKEKLYSIPSYFGLKKSLLISRVCHVLTVIFWIAFIASYGGGIFAYIGLILSILMLLYEHYLVAKNLENIPKAFFVTNGYLGFVFLIFIILDTIFKG